jgi:acid phosphatase
MQESIGGWRELMAFGTDLRFRYPNFYTDNTPFTLWANQYPQAPRVVDSARLFARGYLGPNATTNGNVIVLPSVKTGVIGNSLGPSDSCPTYMDTSGGINATNWNNLYLPPIVSRVNSMIKGNLNFTASDVSTMPYLCGFETQITGKQSPWCSVFTDSELRGYEYAQTLRYYYGNGPGSGGNGTLMLSVLNAVVHRLQDGPNETYTNSAGQDFTPGPLAAMFTNDGQISQLISELGVYDDVAPLPSTSIPSPQKYVASNFVTMRGTVQFERLTCSASATNMNGTSIDVRAGTKKYVRILLNNAVYPVVGCADGPGASCQLKDYADIVNKKMKAAGTLKKRCDIPKNSTATITETATFLKDNALPFQIVVKP